MSSHVSLWGRAATRMSGNHLLFVCVSFDSGGEEKDLGPDVMSWPTRTKNKEIENKMHLLMMLLVRYGFLLVRHGFGIGMCVPRARCEGDGAKPRDVTLRGEGWEKIWVQCQMPRRTALKYSYLLWSSGVWHCFWNRGRHPQMRCSCNNPIGTMRNATRRRAAGSFAARRSLQHLRSWSFQRLYLLRRHGPVLGDPLRNDSLPEGRLPGSHTT